MLALLNLIYFYFNYRIEYWYFFICLNLLLIAAIWKTVSSYEKKVSALQINENTDSSLLKILRYWYGIAAILIIFKQVYFIVFSLKPPDWDLLFIKMDFLIFGTNPTEWVYRFENPILTEFLQIIYAYYYPMIVVFGLELYLWKRFKEYKYTIFIIFFSFYFSYLLYMIFPANGPRFHLHDFSTISSELPGLFLTEYIRAFLNFGESIPSNIPNPQDFVQRDVMPSLHIITAFLIMYLSWKFRSRSFYFYLPYFFCMMAATIYLRYHYVVDLLGGLIVCVLTIILGKIAYKEKFR
jgi:membrane-associated phospholipid phosphatase